MPLEYVASNRKTQLLIYESYTFTRECIRNDKTIWKCSEYKKNHCLGRAHKLNGEVIYHKEHNHPPDFAKIQAKVAYQEMKNAATTSIENPHNLIATQTQNLSNAVIGKLPSVRTMKRTIQKQRVQSSNFPRTPTDIMDIVIPEEFKKTSRGDQFLLHNSGPESDRILIFSIIIQSTIKNLEMLRKSNQWLSDATFKSAPAPFMQVYTIHGIFFSKVMPAVYVVMANKTEASYIKVLNELKNLQVNLNPSSIMTDFEKASINAFKIAFPNAQNRGCFFHFCQCIYRHIQQYGLQQKYAQDSDSALEIRKLAALAFVPVDKVVEYYETLLESEYYKSNEDLIQPLLNYFEDNWIGRLTLRHIRRTPPYPIELWNCYQATLDDLAKTNNSVEGFHRAFNSLLGADHPSIWKFIEGLKSNENMNYLQIEQLIGGVNPFVGRRKYLDNAEKIKQIVSNYRNYEILDYLRGISHNFQYQI